jgi:geranylgeranyl reductase family protein
MTDITCDALIVGGGPAGSTCAWALRRAGLDVMVVDAAVFPRDKVCAGWITPQVVADLHLDVDEYRRGRTFQPITGFRVGLIEGGTDVQTTYRDQVSFGIRRCEFDHYLLQRSGARVKSGTPVKSIRHVTSVGHAGGEWMVNDSIRTPLLIGAGGHFCPVARMVNGPMSAASVVVAQEAEFPIESSGASCAVEGDAPELYFCRDLKGYGWCFRKGDYLNVGLGRLDRRSLPRATAEFMAFLAAKGTLSPETSPRWRGHAYAVYDTPHRRAVGAGVMLVGDAAALAYPQSGEGIRPAIESGLLAAETIVAAKGQYTTNRLEPYEQRLRSRFGTGTVSSALSGFVPVRAGAAVARRLLATPAFVRHVVLDRWFLHRHQPALG